MYAGKHFAPTIETVTAVIDDDDGDGGGGGGDDYDDDDYDDDDDDCAPVMRFDHERVKTFIQAQFQSVA